MAISKNTGSNIIKNGMASHFINHRAQLLFSTWKKYLSKISHNIGSSYLKLGYNLCKMPYFSDWHTQQKTKLQYRQLYKYSLFLRSICVLQPGHLCKFGPTQHYLLFFLLLSEFLVKICSSKSYLFFISSENTNFDVFLHMQFKGNYSSHSVHVILWHT